MTESSSRWPNDGPIVLSAKVDLIIGRPHGTESRKVIIDLKTGRPSVRHRQDLSPVDPDERYQPGRMASISTQLHPRRSAGCEIHRP
jgi:hypothetical protein